MSDPLPPDPYIALGVGKDATLDQIRSSYRKLVLKAHPDRFPNATPDEKQKKADEFHKIQQAYEILSDETERSKYDSTVKLMQAKSDLAKERESMHRRATGRSPQGSQDFTNIFNFTVPIHKTREVPVYEERSSPYTSSNSKKKYDDDHLHSAYEASPKFDGSYRSSPRARAEEFPRAQTRRTSGRDYYEERSRTDDDLDAKRQEKARKQAAKEKSRKVHDQDQKTRDKYRRQEAEAKSYYQSPKVDNTFTESDSEDGRFFPSAHSAKTSSKRRSDEPKKSTRSRRSREDYISDSDDARDHDHYYQRSSARERAAEEHIRFSRGQTGSSDQDDNTRRHRRERMPTAPSPPPTATKEKPDTTAKRSSAKKTREPSREPREPRDTRDAREPRETRTRKSEKPIEIVEPPRKETRRSATDSARSRPVLKPSESAPVGFEPAFGKAATFQVPQREREPAPPRRSKTSNNLESMTDRGRDRDRDRTPPPTGRTRREFASPVAIDDRNGYAPESPAAKNTRYQIIPNLEDNGTQRSVRTVLIEPGERLASRPRAERTASRDVSPRDSGSMRRSNTARPPRGISRAATFQEASMRSSDPPGSPRIQRASTGFRNNSIDGEGMLFREYTDPVTMKTMRPGAPMRSGTVNSSDLFANVAFSPRISPESISYSTHPDGGRSQRFSSDTEDRYRARSPRGSDREGGSRRASKKSDGLFVGRDGGIGKRVGQSMRMAA